MHRYWKGAVALCAVAFAGCAADDAEGPLSTGLGGITTAQGTTGEAEPPDDVLDVGHGEGSSTSIAGGTSDECNASTVEGDLRTLPVDVVMIVDTSSSMQEHTDAIEASINSDFADVMDASGLDFQVIVLAQHGDGAALCVQQPLSSTDCNPPPAVAAETARFHQYDSGTGSEALLQNILDRYNQPDPLGAAPGGWSDWVREDSRKVFLAFSDTASTSNDPTLGTAWDASLLAMDPAVFGTADDRKYIFHAIIGIGYKGEPGAGEPWLPRDGLQLGGECGSDDEQGPGGSIQQVAVVSGGWRFPVCVPSAFSLVFLQVAEAIVEGTPVSCDLEIPPAPEGETIDPDTVEVEYVPGAGAGVVHTQVPSLDDCGADNFYIVDDVIHLCPNACTTVQSDEAAQLRVSYGCDVGYDPPAG